MHKRGLCRLPVSICPSVCLSVTLVYCIQTAEDIVKIFSRPSSPLILVFWPLVPIPNSQGNPSVGAQNTRGTVFSTSGITSQNAPQNWAFVKQTDVWIAKWCESNQACQGNMGLLRVMAPKSIGAGDVGRGGSFPHLQTRGANCIKCPPPFRRLSGMMPACTEKTGIYTI